MDNLDTASLCDIIDITLYKFNHYDNLIWTKCLNQVDYTQINADSILVTPFQLQTMLNLNFKRDLMKIRAITFDLIHTDANSLYFLDKILGDFTRLKWIKLTLSKTRNFSRAVKINDDISQIKYSFKIVKATFRLNEMFEDAELKKINPILQEHNLIPIDKPYKLQPALKILTTLDRALNYSNISDDNAELLAAILDALSFKIENDNPDILLVTDW